MKYVAPLRGINVGGTNLLKMADVHLTGAVADRYSFGPILVGASLVPLLAVVVLLTLVRNTSNSRLVRPI